MANPVSVKGLRKLIGKAGDQVLDDLRRFANNASAAPNPEFHSEAHLTAAGKFAFDKDGELGLVANVVINAAGDVDADALMDWNSLGDGTLEIEYSVSVKSTRVDDA